MGNVLLLITAIVGISIQQISQKAYNKKVGGGAFIFSAASALVAMLVFLIASKGELSFQMEVVGYSVLFAVGYCMALAFSFLAIANGSLSLTSLVLQFSLIIPTFYGILFLQEETDFFLFAGIALLVASIVLVNIPVGEKKEKNAETEQTAKNQNKTTWKWALFALLMFIGNGGCSTVQKMQQIHFNGLYKSEFMIVALIITTVALVVISLFTERKEMLPALKKGVGYYAVYGVANGISNLIVLLLATKMSSSIVYPVLSAGGIVITSFVSVFVYKEKMNLFQKIGLILGVLAIVALNI